MSGGLVVNEFGYQVYKCGKGLKDQCMIDGVGLLKQYGYQLGGMLKNVGITLGFGMRLMGWAAMQWRK
jgi:hypothetical protein